MVILKIIVVLASVFIISLFIERILRKIYQIEKKPGILYKPVNSIQSKGEMILLGIFLVFIITNGFKEWTVEFYPYITLVFLTVNNIFRAFMEWKYDRASKAYILSIHATLLLMIVIIVMAEGSIVRWIFG